MDDMDNLSGVEFENLCQKLITKMGFDVIPTKTTGDGGIDLIAYNNKPLVEGKYIIQCKRYSGSVGEPILRDLYGVVTSERANKGILITTGYFTQSAIDFSKEKPIELINGNKLNILLSQYDIVVNNNSAVNNSSAVRDALRICIDENAQEEYDLLLQEMLNSSDDIVIYIRLIAFAEEAAFIYSVINTICDPSEKNSNIKKCMMESEKYISHMENLPIQNKQFEFLHYFYLCIIAFHHLKFGELDKALKIFINVLKWNELSKSNAHTNNLGYLLALVVNNIIQIYRILKLQDKANRIYNEYSDFILDYMNYLYQNYHEIKNDLVCQYIKKEFESINICSLSDNSFGYFFTIELTSDEVNNFIETSKWDTMKKMFYNRNRFSFTSVIDILNGKTDNKCALFPFSNYNENTKENIKMNANLLT